MILRCQTPRVSFFFAWYDLWVGAYFDRKKCVLYVCPLPCCVFRFELPQRNKGDFRRA
jgi:hypothetical protein